MAARSNNTVVRAGEREAGRGGAGSGAGLAADLLYTQLRGQPPSAGVGAPHASSSAPAPTPQVRGGFGGLAEGAISILLDLDPYFADGSPHHPPPVVALSKDYMRLCADHHRNAGI